MEESQLIILGHGGHYDEETITSIVNITPVAHVSFVPDPTDPVPVILPMIARIGQFKDEPACCYVHGYVSARMFRLPDSGEGVPVCIAATQVVNYVLAITPFNHSYDYRSAVIHGHATLLDPVADRDENVWAMELITNGLVADRWANTRVPPDDTEVASTRILRVRIDSASAKIRDSGVKDDRKDIQNSEVREKVWTGTIPYHETLGTPVPAENNLVKEVPQYITDHIRNFNERSQPSGSDGGGGVVRRVFGSLLGS